MQLIKSLKQDSVDFNKLPLTNSDGLRFSPTYESTPAQTLLVL